MRTASVSRLLLALVGFAAASFFTACAPRSKSATVVSSPISYQHVVRENPAFSIHLISINLDDSRVTVHVARGGPDPDGDGPWLTTLMPTTEIAEREHFDIAINGDFFSAKSTEDVEGRNTGYVKGKFAAPLGAAMTDGQLWHRAKAMRPYLAILSPASARLGEGDQSQVIDPAIRQLIGGSQVIVRNRLPVTYSSKFATDRHPRTAVGIAQNGKQLVLLVVDGRQPELSMGMTLAELSRELIAAGCESAINLDGGGSTTMAYRDPESKKLEILNSPSDMTERSVADILGVTVKAPMPVVK